MRYATLAVAAIAIGWVVFLLIINVEGLSQELTLLFGLPYKPLAVIVMPAWVAAIYLCLIALVLSLALEAYVWHERTRTIRRQRQQIVGLQDQVEEARADVDVASENP